MEGKSCTSNRNNHSLERIVKQNSLNCGTLILQTDNSNNNKNYFRCIYKKRDAHTLTIKHVIVSKWKTGTLTKCIYFISKAQFNSVFLTEFSEFLLYSISYSSTLFFQEPADGQLLYFFDRTFNLSFWLQIS